MSKINMKLSGTLKHALQWVFFTWLFAPLALAISFLAIASIRTEQAHDFSVLLVHGELLIVSAVISIENIGDVVANHDAADGPRMFAIILALAIALISVAWFAILTALGVAETGIKLESGLIVTSSILIYVACLPVGIFCTTVAHSAKVNP